MADVVIINAQTGERTERDFTPEEAAQRALDLAAAQAEQVIRDTQTGNKTSIETQAALALQANRDFIASTPTNAEAVAQVKALSRQMNGVIRLLLNALDGDD